MEFAKGLIPLSLSNLLPSSKGEPFGGRGALAQMFLL